MAAARQRKAKENPLAEAAIEYFAARSHDAWRKKLLKAEPKQKGRPRMRLRGGVMVDVNQPWAKLDARAKADNKRAARDALAAVSKFPRDREAAADYVHKSWVRRNKSDPKQPKALFKSYQQLPETEKDKDRAHVDRMKAALAAVRQRRKRTATPALKHLQIDAKAWARLEAAATALSAQTGRTVSAVALLNTSIEIIALVCEAVEVKPRKR